MMQPLNKYIVLAAGGTGGHMVPAHAVSQELLAHGYEVSLITDGRGLRFPGLFEGVTKHVIASGTPGRGGVKVWFSALKKVWGGRSEAQALYQERRPAVVVGFGGYPALPALLGALSMKIPTALHEQNAVLGRVNRLLARRVDLIATSFEDTAKLSGRHSGKTIVTGNPVRKDIMILRGLPFPDFHAESVFRIMIVGGSQGAKILSDVVPAAIALLPVALRRRLQIAQQCREEDIELVRRTYLELGVAAEVTTYITDMAARLKWSHLFIGRAGASSLAELTAMGRPAILVPLPTATDDHQTMNAHEMATSGAARLIPQTQFSAQELARQIEKIVSEPGALANAAARAKTMGRPDAASRLAGLLSKLAGGEDWSANISMKVAS